MMIAFMGVGRWGTRGVALCIFIHGTDKVEGGLIVLFFVLVFYRCSPSPDNFSADALDCIPMIAF